MEYYVGLDVSLKQTSICVVNQTGSIVQEGVVDSDPETIASFVRSEAPASRSVLFVIKPGRYSARQQSVACFARLSMQFGLLKIFRLQASDKEPRQGTR